MLTIRGQARQVLEHQLSKRGWALSRQWELDLLRRKHEQLRLANTQSYDSLRLVLERYPVDCVIDVGANVGQFATAVRQTVGYQGRIISFEPASNLVRKLQGMASHDAQWEIVPKALGAHPGDQKINLMVSSDLNSFLPPKDDLPAQFSATNVIAGHEVVEVATLDDELTRLAVNDSSKRIFLKLDTQGFDFEVLKGAKRSLDSISVLQTEMSVVHLYDGSMHWLEFLSKLEDMNFSIVRANPVSWDHDTLSVVEFDCIFVRKDER